MRKEELEQALVDELCAILAHTGAWPTRYTGVTQSAYTAGACLALERIGQRFGIYDVGIQAEQKLAEGSKEAQT